MSQILRPLSNFDYKVTPEHVIVSLVVLDDKQIRACLSESSLSFPSAFFLLCGVHECGNYILSLTWRDARERAGTLPFWDHKFSPFLSINARYSAYYKLSVEYYAVAVNSP
jgi:hypothetical protein